MYVLVVNDFRKRFYSALIVLELLRQAGLLVLVYSVGAFVSGNVGDGVGSGIGAVLGGKCGSLKCINANVVVKLHQ